MQYCVWKFKINVYSIPHSVFWFYFSPLLLSLPILEKEEIGYIGDYDNEVAMNAWKKKL